MFQDLKIIALVTSLGRTKRRIGLEGRRAGAGELASITWCFYGRSLMCWRLMKKQQLGLRTGVISSLPLLYPLFEAKKENAFHVLRFFLIRVIWTEVLRAFRSPWLHFVRIRSKLLYTVAFLILGPTIKEEVVKTL